MCLIEVRRRDNGIEWEHSETRGGVTLRGMAKKYSTPR